MRLRYGAKRGPWLAAAAALFLPVAAYAQDDALPDPGVMRAIEAAIPPQSWYPDGYRDIRIAAEATLADRPHGGQPDTTTGFASFGSADLIVCDHDYSAADWGDPATTSLGRIAMDSARFRAKLRQLGYPENLYDAPLLDFEKARLEQEASPETPAPASDPRFALAAAINDNRLKLAPDLPPVSASRFCPIAAPGASFAFPIAGILGGGGGGGGSPGGPAAVVFATDPCGRAGIADQRLRLQCLRAQAARSMGSPEMPME